MSFWSGFLIAALITVFFMFILNELFDFEIAFSVAVVIGLGFAGLMFLDNFTNKIVDAEKEFVAVELSVPEKNVYYESEDDLWYVGDGLYKIEFFKGRTAFDVEGVKTIVELTEVSK